MRPLTYTTIHLGRLESLTRTHIYQLGKETISLILTIFMRLFIGYSIFIRRIHHKNACRHMLFSAKATSKIGRTVLAKKLYIFLYGPFCFYLFRPMKDILNGFRFNDWMTLKQF